MEKANKAHEISLAFQLQVHRPIEQPEAPPSPLLEASISPLTHCELPSPIAMSPKWTSPTPEPQESTPVEVTSNARVSASNTWPPRRACTIVNASHCLC
jgi:hypothetical protein